MFILAGFVISISVVVLLCLKIWMRYRKSRPFRARLSIRFLLFVLLPIIPLTFLVSILITQSAEVLLPQKPADAMNKALNAMRIEMEQSSARLLTTCPPKSWHFERLQETRTACLFIYRIGPDTLHLVRHIQSDSWHLPSDRQPSQRHLRERWQRGLSSQIRPVGKASLFYYFHSLPDSELVCLVRQVPDHWQEAQLALSQAIVQYNTLALFKESILSRKLIWILAFLFIAVMIGLTLWVAQRMSRELAHPIRHLVAGMQVVATGDLSHQIDCEAKDEFRFLIARFNAMIRDLDDANRRLIQIETMAARQTVARQLSHEIKNSLTPITISMHRLKTRLGESLPKKAERMLVTIQEELCVLENMASAFSEFARLPAPKKIPVQINAILESAARLQQETHPDLKIHCLFDDAIPEMSADQDQMKRVFNNLIINAIEASETAPVISIVSRSKGNTLYVTVQDQGRGMNENTLNRIFHPHFTTKPHGAGLGMAMVQKIIQDHGGVMAIESRPGKGTTISVQLPLEMSHQQENTGRSEAGCVASSEGSEPG